MKTELNWAAFYSVLNIRTVRFGAVRRSSRWRPQRASRRPDSIPLLARPVRRSARWRELV